MNISSYKTKGMDIYIGLGNQVDDKRYEDREKVKERLSLLFNEYKIDFSIVDLVGGYILEDGTYIIEDSLKVSLIGEKNHDDLIELFNDVKKLYNQEKILVDIHDIEVKFR